MNLKSKFLEDKEKGYVEDYINGNKEFMKENDLSDLDSFEVTNWFLLNAHETITRISSSLCGLSKSTYDASIYISEIQHHQMIWNNLMIKDDLMEIINDEDFMHEEKLNFIQKYLDELETP